MDTQAKPQLFSESLSDPERRHARMLAYASTWFGCFSEVMMDSSAILIIFMTMMRGSELMVMMTTSLSGICSMLLVIPCAVIIPHIGLKRAVKIACWIGTASYLLIASAPLWGSSGAKYIVLTGCVFYCISRPLYSAAWYPLLDNFLRPQDRGDFFGWMRFSYMLITGAAFFVIGLLMGKNPPVWFMQLVIGIAGLFVMGRWFFICRFPMEQNGKKEAANLRKALFISLTNSPLIGYSVYACLFTMAYTSLYPLTLIYLKSFVHLPAGQVQIISSIGIGGSIVGFFCYGRLLRRTNLRFIELCIHCVFAGISICLFFCNPKMPGFLFVVSVLVFLTMFFHSCFLCCNSAELMALARPGNKLMASAICQTYTNAGNAFGRTASSLLIGSAILMPTWIFAGGITVSCYQTLFLCCGTLIIILFLLLPLLPAFVPKHHDYYRPK